MSQQPPDYAPPPTILDPDFSKLRDMILGGVNQSVQDGYENDDFEHYVYEEAMKAVYGPNYFEWRSRQKW